MNFKSLVGGVVLVLCIGIAGFLYRSVMERPTGPIACTADAKICPDGTGLGRTEPQCTFPACPPPNVEIENLGLAFALPGGYVANEEVSPNDPTIVASYVKPALGSPTDMLVIRRFALSASTTPADFVRENAIMDPSGLPAPPTAFSSITLGLRRFSMVTLGRFEGTVDTAYYLARDKDVIRFDAVSLQVPEWTDPNLDVLSLGANKDLKALLGTLQGT
jgi:hypothetical protein